METIPEVSSDAQEVSPPSTSSSYPRQSVTQPISPVTVVHDRAAERSNQASSQENSSAERTTSQGELPDREPHEQQQRTYTADAAAGATRRPAAHADTLATAMSSAMSAVPVSSACVSAGSQEKTSAAKASSGSRSSKEQVNEFVLRAAANEDADAPQLNFPHALRAPAQKAAACDEAGHARLTSFQSEEEEVPCSSLPGQQGNPIGGGAEKGSAARLLTGHSAEGDHRSLSQRELALFGNSNDSSPLLCVDSEASDGLREDTGRRRSCNSGSNLSSFTSRRARELGDHVSFMGSDSPAAVISPHSTNFAAVRGGQFSRSPLSRHYSGCSEPLVPLAVFSPNSSPSLEGEPGNNPSGAGDTFADKAFTATQQARISLVSSSMGSIPRGGSRESGKPLRHPGTSRSLSPGVSKGDKPPLASGNSQVSSCGSGGLLLWRLAPSRGEHGEFEGSSCSRGSAHPFSKCSSIDAPLAMMLASPDVNEIDELKGSRIVGSTTGDDDLYAAGTGSFSRLARSRDSKVPIYSSADEPHFSLGSHSGASLLRRLERARSPQSESVSGPAAFSASRNRLFGAGLPTSPLTPEPIMQSAAFTPQRPDALFSSPQEPSQTLPPSSAIVAQSSCGLHVPRSRSDKDLWQCAAEDADAPPFMKARNVEASSLLLARSHAPLRSPAAAGNPLEAGSANGARTPSDASPQPPLEEHPSQLSSEQSSGEKPASTVVDSEDRLEGAGSVSLTPGDRATSSEHTCSQRNEEECVSSSTQALPKHRKSGAGSRLRATNDRRSESGTGKRPKSGLSRRSSETPLETPDDNTNTCSPSHSSPLVSSDTVTTPTTVTEDTAPTSARAKTGSLAQKSTTQSSAHSMAASFPRLPGSLPQVMPIHSRADERGTVTRSRASKRHAAGDRKKWHRDEMEQVSSSSSSSTSRDEMADYAKAVEQVQQRTHRRRAHRGGRRIASESASSLTNDAAPKEALGQPASPSSEPKRGLLQHLRGIMNGVFGGWYSSGHWGSPVKSSTLSDLASSQSASSTSPLANETALDSSALFHLNLGRQDVVVPKGIRHFSLLWMLVPFVLIVTTVAVGTFTTVHVVSKRIKQNALAEIHSYLLSETLIMVEDITHMPVFVAESIVHKFVADGTAAQVTDRPIPSDDKMTFLLCSTLRRTELFSMMSSIAYVSYAGKGRMNMCEQSGNDGVLGAAAPERLVDGRIASSTLYVVDQQHMLIAEPRRPASVFPQELTLWEISHQSKTASVLSEWLSTVKRLEEEMKSTQMGTDAGVNSTNVTRVRWSPPDGYTSSRSAIAHTMAKTMMYWRTGRRTWPSAAFVYPFFEYNSSTPSYVSVRLDATRMLDVFKKQQDPAVLKYSRIALISGELLDNGDVEPFILADSWQNTTAQPRKELINGTRMHWAFGTLAASATALSVSDPLMSAALQMLDIKKYLRQNLLPTNVSSWVDVFLGHSKTEVQCDSTFRDSGEFMQFKYDNEIATVSVHPVRTKSNLTMLMVIAMQASILSSNIDLTPVSSLRGVSQRLTLLPDTRPAAVVGVVVACFLATFGVYYTLVWGLLAPMRVIVEQLEDATAIITSNNDGAESKMASKDSTEQQDKHVPSSQSPPQALGEAKDSTESPSSPSTVAQQQQQERQLPSLVGRAKSALVALWSGMLESSWWRGRPIRLKEVYEVYAECAALQRRMEEVREYVPEGVFVDNETSKSVETFSTPSPASPVAVSTSTPLHVPVHDPLPPAVEDAGAASIEAHDDLHRRRRANPSLRISTSHGDTADAQHIDSSISELANAVPKTPSSTWLRNIHAMFSLDQKTGEQEAPAEKRSRPINSSHETEEGSQPRDRAKTEVDKKVTAAKQTQGGSASTEADVTAPAMAAANRKSTQAHEVSSQSHSKLSIELPSPWSQQSPASRSTPFDDNSFSAGQPYKATPAGSENSYRKCFCTMLSITLALRSGGAAAEQYIPEIMEVVVDAARKYGGTFDIFIPEMLYISFGSRTRTKDHALKATKCGIEIYSRLSEGALHYISFIIDSGVYYTGVCGVPERKGFVLWGRPSGELFGPEQDATGFRFMLLDTVVPLIQRRFRLLPVDVMSVMEEPGSPQVIVYCIFKGSVNSPSWMPFSQLFNSAFASLLAKRYDTATKIFEAISGSPHFPMYGIFLLTLARHSLIKSNRSRVGAAETARQLNETSATVVQDLSSRSTVTIPFGSSIPHIFYDGHFTSLTRGATESKARPSNSVRQSIEELIKPSQGSPDASRGGTTFSQLLNNSSRYRREAQHDRRKRSAERAKRNHTLGVPILGGGSEAHSFDTTDCDSDGSSRETEKNGTNRSRRANYSRQTGTTASTGAVSGHLSPVTPSSSSFSSTASTSASSTPSASSLLSTPTTTHTHATRPYVAASRTSSFGSQDTRRKNSGKRRTPVVGVLHTAVPPVSERPVDPLSSTDAGRSSEASTRPSAVPEESSSFGHTGHDSFRAVSDPTPGGASAHAYLVNLYASVPRVFKDVQNRSWRRSIAPMADGTTRTEFIAVSENGVMAALSLFSINDRVVGECGNVRERELPPVRHSSYADSSPDPATTSSEACKTSEDDSRVLLGTGASSPFDDKSNFKEDKTTSSSNLAEATMEGIDVMCMHEDAVGYYHENIVQYISCAVIKDSALVQKTTTEYVQRPAVIAAEARDSFPPPYFCLIQELVPGGTLRESVVRYGRPLPLGAIRRYCVSILRALDYLHKEKSVVHGRLQPECILVGVEGSCKINGMNYLYEWARDDQELYEILTEGKASYRSPEVNRGEPKSAAADIFSFGLILLEMLTGSLPWTWAGDVNTGLYSRSRDELSAIVNDNKLFLESLEQGQIEMRQYGQKRNAYNTSLNGYQQLSDRRYAHSSVVSSDCGLSAPIPFTDRSRSNSTLTPAARDMASPLNAHEQHSHGTAAAGEAPSHSSGAKWPANALRPSTAQGSRSTTSVSFDPGLGPVADAAASMLGRHSSTATPNTGTGTSFTTSSSPPTSHSLPNTASIGDAVGNASVTGTLAPSDLFAGASAVNNTVAGDGYFFSISTPADDGMLKVLEGCLAFEADQRKSASDLLQLLSEI